jgi:hypothetical protein
MTLAAARINHYSVCIVCARRSDGLAAGKPGRLGWYCYRCGPELAREVLEMLKSKDLDPVEQRACETVAALCGVSEITLSAAELADFVAWAVKEFGDALRKEIEDAALPY